MDDVGAGKAAREALRRAGVAILHEDNHLLGLAKPAGLPAQGGPRGIESLVDLVERYRAEAEGKPGRAYVGLVHRLDRNVSGALVVAKTSKAAARLAALFRERSASLEKTYLAWVCGVPDAEGALEHRLRRAGGVTRLAAPGDDDGREASLAFRREGHGPDDARVRIRLGTGLTHQIRCQMALAGHPLHGDPKYGGPPGPRPALHALELRIPHPVGGAPIVLRARVPEDLLRLDARLRIEPRCEEGR